MQIENLRPRKATLLEYFLRRFFVSNSKEQRATLEPFIASLEASRHQLVYSIPRFIQISGLRSSVSAQLAPQLFAVTHSLKSPLVTIAHLPDPLPHVPHFPSSSGFCSSKTRFVYAVVESSVSSASCQKILS